MRSKSFQSHGSPYPRFRTFGSKAALGAKPDQLIKGHQESICGEHQPMLVLHQQNRDAGKEESSSEIFPVQQFSHGRLSRQPAFVGCFASLRPSMTLQGWTEKSWPLREFSFTS